ncbi:monocarboxylate transporter 3-like isoform X2 [Artemia franciscana]
MGISMFAPSVAFLYLSVGLLTGFGFGLIYLPAIVSVTCYFDKKRSFATGIAVCGSGIGTFLFAPLTEWLVQNFSWKGAMLILSGICLNNVFFGALFRPLEPVQKKDTPLNVLKDSHEDKQLLPVKTLNGKVPFEGSTRSSKSGSFHEECRMTSSSPHLTVPEQENESDCGSEGTLQKLRSRSVANSRQDSQQSLYGVMYRQDILYSRSLTNLPQNKSNLKINCSSSVRLSEGDEQDNQSKKYVVCGFIPCSKEARDAYKEMMDLSLLADPVFLLFTVSNFCTSIGFNVPYVYIKDKALESGVDSTTASALIAWIGGANTVSRVILGYISDSPKINRLFLYNSALTICGFSTILSSFCFDYTSLAVYACVFGATAGAYVGLTSVILVDLLGLEKLTNAFGLLLLFQGIASLIGPPIGGMLFDISGSYDLCFYGAGSMIAASGLMLFFVPCLQKRSNANLDSIKV